MAEPGPKRIGPGSGSDDSVPLKFEQTDLANMLTGAARVMNDLVTRHMIDVSSGQVEVPPMEPDASLTVLNDLVHAFSSGEALDRIKPDVDRLTMAQEDRMTLVNSLTTQHSLIRMVRLMMARDRLERFMLSSVERSDLTPSEALLFLKMIQTDMSEIQTQIKPTPIKDSKGLIDKVDYAQKKAIADTLSRYDNTSPQGREIIRKIIHGLLKKDGSGKPVGTTGPGDSDKKPQDLE
jgi:hypothetical protein